MNITDNPHLHKTDVSHSTLLFGDCLIESDKIESGTVDLILTDLPYGKAVNLKAMFLNIKKTMKDCTQRKSQFYYWKI